MEDRVVRLIVEKVAHEMDPCHGKGVEAGGYQITVRRERGYNREKYSAEIIVPIFTDLVDIREGNIILGDVESAKSTDLSLIKPELTKGAEGKLPFLADYQYAVIGSAQGELGESAEEVLEKALKDLLGKIELLKRKEGLKTKR